MNVETGRTIWDLRGNDAIAQALRYTRLPLCFTDPNQPDNPIVFANTAFCQLTGYEMDEILGRNCRFLQGKDTTPESIEQIRDVIEQQRVSTVEVQNYRKDGTPFMNALQLGPIMDDNGHLVFYFGAQLDVTDKHRELKASAALAKEELLHRLRNIVNVMSVTVKLTSGSESNVREAGRKINERLHALSEAHFSTFADSDEAGTDLSEIARSILSAYAPLGEKQFALSGDEVMLPGGLISPITLVLHELATNAVKHGALSVPDGRVKLKWSIDNSSVPHHLHLTWQERQGPEVIVPERHSGSKIIGSLVSASGGTLDLDWQAEGLVAHARFPIAD